MQEITALAAQEKIAASLEVRASRPEPAQCFALAGSSALTKPELLPQVLASKKHIVLIGPMGSGKSTLAQQLKKIFKLPVIDTDQLIESQCRKKIPQIFSDEGESHFRALEVRALRDCVSGPPSIIATGGGIVVSPENCQLLREHFVVWLHITPRLAIARIVGSGRPLLKVAAPAEQYRRIYEQRLPLYAQCASVLFCYGQQASAELAEFLCQNLQEKFAKE